LRRRNESGKIGIKMEGGYRGRTRGGMGTRMGIREERESEYEDVMGDGSDTGRGQAPVTSPVIARAPFFGPALFDKPPNPFSSLSFFPPIPE
jgi:hypothetical protein